ncbi:MAG: hypothetical protein IKD44_12770 [Lentisphaeria bacterium]|nr:hypothetical protein [Lentisphaeria bacterium]
MRRFFLIAAMLSLLCSVTGCGTLFFSHRMGKKLSKTIDNRVFYTDCFLCLFGVVPGVVAFILDYENGTIYYTEAELLPDDLFGMKKLPGGNMTPEEIAEKLSAALDKEISSSEIREALRVSSKMGKKGKKIVFLEESA